MSQRKKSPKKYVERKSPRNSPRNSAEKSLIKSLQIRLSPRNSPKKTSKNKVKQRKRKSLNKSYGRKMDKKIGNNILTKPGLYYNRNPNITIIDNNIFSCEIEEIVKPELLLKYVLDENNVLWGYSTADSTFESVCINGLPIESRFVDIIRYNFPENVPEFIAVQPGTGNFFILSADGEQNKIIVIDKSGENVYNFFIKKGYCFGMCFDKKGNIYVIYTSRDSGFVILAKYDSAGRFKKERKTVVSFSDIYEYTRNPVNYLRYVNTNGIDNIYFMCKKFLLVYDENLQATDKIDFPKNINADNYCVDIKGNLIFQNLGEDEDERKLYYVDVERHIFGNLNCNYSAGNNPIFLLQCDKNGIIYIGETIQINNTDEEYVISVIEMRRVF